MDEPQTPLPDQTPPSDEPSREAEAGPDAPPSEEPSPEADAGRDAPAPEEMSREADIGLDFPGAGAQTIEHSPVAPAPAEDIGTFSSRELAPVAEVYAPERYGAAAEAAEPAEVRPVSEATAGAIEDEAAAPVEGPPVFEAAAGETEYEVAAPAEEPPVLESTAGETVDLAPPPAADARDAAVAEAEAAEKARAAEEHDRLARENADRLEREIEALRSEHGEGAHRNYRSFFEHERQLHLLFKKLRPLHAADRHRLWNTFKQIGAEARREQQEEWESRRYLSIEARETVDEKIRTAEGLMQGAPTTQDYRRADGILNEVRSLLASSAPGSPGQVLIGPDRRACWDRWRHVRDALRHQRGGLQEQDYQSLAGLVAEAIESANREDPFKAIQRVKELQVRLGKAYLRRGQFEELRRRLSDAWQAAQVRITEQRQERTKSRAEWRERMEGHVSRWRETLEHRRGQREHLLQQLAKLEGMEKNARSEDFAVQVRGWREETTDKLRRVEEFIADLEQRVGSAAKKLGGRGPREHAAEEPAAGEGSAGTSSAPTAEPPDALEAEPRDSSASEPPGEDEASS